MCFAGIIHVNTRVECADMLTLQWRAAEISLKAWHHFQFQGSHTMPTFTALFSHLHKFEQWKSS